MNKSSESMTSEISSTNEDWIKDIDADGFIFLTDSAVGERVEEFAENEWPRTTIEGLNFIQASTIDDAVSRFYSTWVILF